jgi:hypothetical protein
MKKNRTVLCDRNAWNDRRRVKLHRICIIWSICDRGAVYSDNRGKISSN